MDMYSLQDRTRGSLVGAAVGCEVIPQFYKDDLELHDLILHMADDLYQGEISSFT